MISCLVGGASIFLEVELTSLDSSSQAGDPVQSVLGAGLNLCFAAGLAQASLLGSASRGRFLFRAQHFRHVWSVSVLDRRGPQSSLAEIVVLNKTQDGDVERSMDQRVEQRLCGGGLLRCSHLLSRPYRSSE
jgi:hypothetical protein